MKKLIRFLSIALIVFPFSACVKTSIPENQVVETSAARKGGGGGNTATITFGGQATALNAVIFNTGGLVVTSNQTILAQTAVLPSNGGSVQASAVQANIPEVLTADVLTASTVGQGNSTVSEASVTNLNVTIDGNTISATSVHSTANASCGNVLSGKSVIENLVVNGTAITVTGATNQAIYLPGGGMIILNEQSAERKAKPASITVTGIHIILPKGSDIRIASAKADIKC